MTVLHGIGFIWVVLCHVTCNVRKDFWVGAGVPGYRRLAFWGGVSVFGGRRFCM